MKKAEQHLKEHGNLPDFLKDFHDQKEIFKTIAFQYKEGNQRELLKNVNWVNAHCYTIDCFLWWMGMHGYKLQKDRARNVEFYNIEETIKYWSDMRTGGLKDIIKNKLNKK